MKTTIKRKCKGMHVSKVHLIMMLAIFMLIPHSALADVAGASAFSTAESTISGYLPFVQKLIYAIAAVISLVGAFNVYFKMQNGDQDVKKTIMMTMGGCIALICLATTLPSFFGH